MNNLTASITDSHLFISSGVVSFLRHWKAHLLEDFVLHGHAGNAGDLGFHWSPAEFNLSLLYWATLGT